MHADGLPVPNALQSLIIAGRWPRDADEARRQHVQPLIPAERVEALTHDESFIYLLPPSQFSSVARLVAGGESFWRSPHADPDGIAFDRTLVIADFGLGSDSPIVFDYRRDPPAVLRLRWSEGGEANQWEELAPSFRAFAQRLGLILSDDVTDSAGTADSAHPRRIIVYGNSGSGKTTMTAALAARFNIPHLDLDTIAWDGVAVRRPLAASVTALRAFIDANPDWVIEGCYGQLVEAALPWCTELRFLNPGVAACARNCRARPWEPHKYATRAEQDEWLALLIRWVEQYELREDEFSLDRHREIFDSFAGPKHEYGDTP